MIAAPSDGRLARRPAEPRHAATFAQLRVADAVSRTIFGAALLGRGEALGAGDGRLLQEGAAPPARRARTPLVPCIGGGGQSLLHALCGDGPGPRCRPGVEAAHRRGAGGRQSRRRWATSAEAERLAECPVELCGLNNDYNVYTMKGFGHRHVKNTRWPPIRVWEGRQDY